MEFILTNDNLKQFENEEPASFDEILVEQLETINKPIPELIGLICSKLRLNGTIKIKGLDIYTLAIAIEKEEVDLGLINQVLYKENRVQCNSIETIVGLLEQYRITIISKKYTSKFGYYIVGKRVNHANPNNL